MNFTLVQSVKSLCRKSNLPIVRAVRQAMWRVWVGKSVFIVVYLLVLFRSKLSLFPGFFIALVLGWLAAAAFNQLWLRLLCLRRDPAVRSLTALRPGPTPGDWNLAEVFLEATRRKYSVPGLVAAAVIDGRLRAIGAAGVRQAGGTERVILTDLFHLGSCTKSMTATMIARLVEAGKLSWDLTLEKALPDLAPAFHRQYRAVTLRQLLAHRAGCPTIWWPKSSSLPELYTLPGSSREQRTRFVQAMLAQKPARKPGRSYLYSNVGYAVATCVAETITGHTWEDLMRTQLFDPLGLTSAGFGSPGSPGARDQPWGHLPNTLEPIPPGPEADLPLAVAPAGSIHSDIKDFAHFAAFHLSGARGQTGLLLKPGTFAELHTDPFKKGYALGWMVAKRGWAGGTALYHSGSIGLWTAYIWLAPAKNAAFVVAANCGDLNGAGACDVAVVRLIRKFL